MNKPLILRRVSILAIMLALVGSAALCGQVRQIPEPPPAAPATQMQPPAGGDEAPNPPTACKWKVGPDPHHIILTWQYDSPQNIDGFRIYMATTDFVMDVKSNNLTATVKNLDLNVQYHFDVRAYKGASESKVDACFVDATTGQ
jgi:Fibronectin type III domain